MLNGNILKGYLNVFQVNKITKQSG